MRKLTPIMEHFLGDTFTPKTSINSPIYYGEGVGRSDNSWRRILLVSCKSTKTFTEKKEGVQLFEQLAAYKFIFAYNLFEIPD